MMELPVLLWGGVLQLEAALEGGGLLEADIGSSEVPSLPVYSGPYTLIPGQQVRVLETAGKRMTDNIRMEPMPSNYGRITYNGCGLTIA